MQRRKKPRHLPLVKPSVRHTASQFRLLKHKPLKDWLSDEHSLASILISATSIQSLHSLTSHHSIHKNTTQLYKYINILPEVKIRSRSNVNPSVVLLSISESILEALWSSIWFEKEDVKISLFCPYLYYTVIYTTQNEMSHVYAFARRDMQCNSIWELPPSHATVKLAFLIVTFNILSFYCVFKTNLVNNDNWQLTKLII